MDFFRSQEVVHSPSLTDGGGAGETQGAQGTGSPSPLSKREVSWEKTSWRPPGFTGMSREQEQRLCQQDSSREPGAASASHLKPWGAAICGG